PQGPVSAKPPETTTRPRTPLTAHCVTTSSTAKAGTHTTARSTCCGKAVSDSKVGTPNTSPSADVLTANRLPLKPLSTRSRRTVWPTLSGSRLAPTTTTDVGARSRLVYTDSA